MGALNLAKAYGSYPVWLTQITVQPIGIPTSEGQSVALDEPFLCVEGARLDLSAYWSMMIERAKILERVLPNQPPTDTESKTQYNQYEYDHSAVVRIGLDHSNYAACK